CETRKVPEKTALKTNRSPVPAWWPLPCATMVPVKLPDRSVVTSTIGRVFTFTPEVLPGTVPAGGVKVMVGNVCPKTGVAVGGVLKSPLPSEWKKRPWTVLVEITCVGTTQVTTAVLDCSPLEATARTVSSPALAPE